MTDNLAEQFETVGDILRQNPQLPGEGEPDAPISHVVPPRLDGQPEFPAPGIYFGLDERSYHAILALSTSGIKSFSASCADYWEDSVLNPDREEVKTDYFDFGKAIHCFVLEGEDCYAARYVIGLEKTADVLDTSDDIKTAIIEAGHAPITSVPTGQMKPSPTKAEPDRMVPHTRPSKKDDLIDQLIEISPDAQIWDRMQASFFAEHEGAEIITHKIDRRVRIAAAMILRQEDIAENFRDGYAEVSIFWHCPATGCPMKMRADYLKLARIVDLKSFTNKTGAPIDRAVEKTIGNMRYNVQHVVYDEGVEAAKALIRQHGMEVVHDCDEPSADESDARQAFALDLANQPEPDFMFVFQKSNKAPVTRGKIMPRENMGVFGVTRSRVEGLKRAWIACCEVYGADPWLDIRPVEQIDDEALPMWATEI